MNLRMLRGKRAMGEGPGRIRKGWALSLRCGVALGWEKRVASSEMAGKKVLLGQRHTGARTSAHG